MLGIDLTRFKTGRISKMQKVYGPFVSTPKAWLTQQDFPITYFKIGLYPIHKENVHSLSSLNTLTQQDLKIMTSTHYRISSRLLDQRERCTISQDPTSSHKEANVNKMETCMMLLAATLYSKETKAESRTSLMRKWLGRRSQHGLSILQRELYVRFCPSTVAIETS